MTILHIPWKKGIARQRRTILQCWQDPSREGATPCLKRVPPALPSHAGVSHSHRRMEEAPLRSHHEGRLFPHPCPIQRPSALTPSSEMEKPPIPWNEGLNRSQYSRTISHAKRRACYSRRGRTRPDQREWEIQRPESPRPWSTCAAASIRFG